MNEILRRGDKGSPVSSLQSILDARGYDLGRYGVDGDFGRSTLRAVQAFQMAEGLTVDGVVGRATWKALLEMVGAPESTASFVPLLDGSAASRAIAAALDDLGAKEFPNGSNCGPDLVELVEGYRQHIRSSNPKAPAWCAIAVCVWTARALGLGHVASEIDWSAHPFGFWRGSTVSDSDRYSLLEWAKDNGRLLPADGPAPPGSIFLMITREASGSDEAGEGTAAIGHCGLVIADHGDRIETIDGNVSNKVKRCTRTKASLHGYVVWW